MQKIISFDADILKGLALNSDMLSSYVLAAISDQGQGVKVCWSLWPHLTPPAKVGGVARALAKIGLLVSMPGGLYQVVTSRGAATKRGERESGADDRRQTSEAQTKAPEGLEVGDFDESGIRAEQEQKTIDDEATSQHEASNGDMGGDIEALEVLLDSMTIKETVVDEDPASTIGTGIQQPLPTLEDRARALARRSWEIMPDPVKERVNHDFDLYWQQSKSQHMRTASNA